MTKLEASFPDFSERNVYDYSPSPASLPNAKELVSGVFQDGTPVFSLYSKKIRASRFVSASHARDKPTKVDITTFDDLTPQLDANKSRGSRFGSAFSSRDVSLRVDPAIEEVPPPFDNKRILSSIEFLKVRLAALEKDRAQDEIKIQLLQLENRILRAESKERVRKRHRRDIALDTTDVGSQGDDEMDNGQRKLILEKNRLEASVRKLQERIKLLIRAASESELNLQKITKDRDSANSQLRAAKSTMNQLKADNQTLRERNSMLKRKVDDMAAIQYTATVNKNIREEVFDKESEPREHVEAKEKELEKRLKTTQPAFNAELLCQETAPKQSGSFPSQSTNADDSNPTREIPYLSGVTAGEIGELRKTLEIERLARSKKRTSRRHASNIDIMVEGRTSDEQPQQSKAKCKSPRIEPIRRRISKPRALMQESASSDDRIQQLTIARKSPAAEPVSRRISKTNPKIEEASYNGRINRLEPMRKSGNKLDRRNEDSPAISTRRGIDKPGEMTFDRIINKDKFKPSGFEGYPSLIPFAEAEIPCHKDSLPNFTRRVEQESTILDRESNVLSLLVPVVKQRIKLGPCEEGPTLRPSQSPALALLTVIKGLKDELSVEKRQLAQYQDLYNNQNPSLAKRARKSLMEKIDALLRSVDGKADQIYSLYDVVEGQKQHDQMISNKELEGILQSLGIEKASSGPAKTKEPGPPNEVGEILERKI
ncbi:hypothetical protein MMC07_006715 [Pseudocyphellaria aurata]|nr:hypothetical protein [Pseudocyphellaria aurata]